MRYKCEITINKPIQELIQMYENPDNLTKWMKGLESIELISGTLGQKKSKSKLVFQMGKRRIEMIETILENDMPRLYEAQYEAKGVFNIVSNSMQKIDDHTTRYISNNYFKFKGIMKIVAFFMSSAFKKQTLGYMEDFKDFAEKN